MARIALLEPYYTGSHAHWADGLAGYSSHAITRYLLPGRFWKWRMHGGAVTLARQFVQASGRPDLILATDMLDLAAFLGLARHHTAGIPTAVYFHENQLTYPPPPGEKRNLTYGFTNYTSMLAADRVFFNSAFHRDAFFDELPRLLKHFPDFNELDTVDRLAARSEVLPLGLDLRRFDAHRPQAAREGPLRILWNHRWEYDKQPEVFFGALETLQKEGIAFEVIVLGESFQRRPAEFLRAQEQLAERLLHFGYADDFAIYAHLLWEADVSVSCAIQDFFGASTVEAIYCGCLPLLPDRLNYPALIPQEYRAFCLYADPDELIRRLRWVCEYPERARAVSLRGHVARFDWYSAVADYDRRFQAIIEGGQAGI